MIPATIKKTSTIILLLIIIIITMHSALATIDLASPENNYLTNNDPIEFSAYITPIADSCSLIIDGETIDTLTNVQGLIDLEASPDDDYHEWKFLCQRSGTPEESASRNISVDRTAPIINLVSPEENTSTSTIQLEVNVQDDNYFTCQVSLGIELLDLFNLTNYSEELEPQTLDSGNYTLNISCEDLLGNKNYEIRNFEYQKPLEPLFISLETTGNSFALGESATLTIDSVEDGTINIEICPDEEGFVECYTPIIDSGEFPINISLPTSKAGSFLVDAYVTRESETSHDSLIYNITNTMSISISPNKIPKLNREVELTASANNGIGSYNYTWTLSNGSTYEGPTVTKLYDTIGTITDTVVVIDEEGNIAQKAHSADITPLFNLLIKVKDFNGNKIVNATAQIDGETIKTNNDGEAVFELGKSKYEVYVGKNGYDFYFEELEITEDQTLEVTLNADDNIPPKVSITYPVNDLEVPSKINLKFDLEEKNPKKCTLLADNGGDGWFTETGTYDIDQEGTYQFKDIVLSNEDYVFKVECVDENGNKGSSEEVAVKVNHELTAAENDGSLEELSSDYDGEVGDYQVFIDETYEFLDSLSEREREAAELLGIYDKIDSYSREVSRIARDINDINYRRDLTEEEKDAKEQEYYARLDAIVSDIPLSIKVTNTKTLVKYLKEDDLLSFAEKYISIKNIDLKPEKLVKLIMPLQQKFTSKMNLMNVEVVSNTETKDYTVASFDNDLSAVDTTNLQLLFEIPEEFAVNSRKIIGSDLEVLSENPLVIYREAPSSDDSDSKQLVFYVEKKVELSKVAMINEVLFKESLLTLKQGFGSSITGAVTGVSIDWSTSIYLSLALIIILFLVGKFWGKLRYFIYELSSKKKTHYLRVLANDAIDKLQVGSYEEANMIYEELRLEYEKAHELIQNDVYSDVMKVCSELDQTYLMQLSNKISEDLENENLEAAINNFEKLEGTYNRLNNEQKTKVEELVEAIASKLGMT